MRDNGKSNTKTNTKEKTKEFQLDEKFQEKYIEFGRIYTNGKNLILEHSKAGLIISKYYSDDITKTIDALKETFMTDEKIDIEFSDNLAKDFLKDFAQILARRILQDAQEAEQNEEQTQGREDEKYKRPIQQEIKALKLTHPDLTVEKWQSILQQKHDELYDTIQKNMPDIWPGLEFVLSVLRILNLHDCTQPFIGLLLGRPGSGKTVILSLFRDWVYAFYKDSFTPKAFESHTTAVNSKEELEQIDMLPQMNGNIFLTPELAPIFSKKEDELVEILGMIIRLADGEGFSSHSGAHGGREYRNIMFTWGGAAVDIPNKVYKILSILGPKWYHFRLPFKEKTEAELIAEAKQGEDFGVRRQAIKEALFDYLKWFEIAPHSQITATFNDVTANVTTNGNVHTDVSTESPIIDVSLKPKIKWDKSRDDDQAHKFIVKVAMLLTHLRCAVQTWDSYRGDEEISYEASICEDPSRTRQVLYNLARGHALQIGRNYITLDDVPIVVKTVLSTAHIDRVAAFSLLISMPEGHLTTAQIMQFLNKSKHFALKVMIEFKAIGLVDMSDVQIDGINPQTGIPFKTYSKQITLRKEFEWFLSEEFDRLRDSFVATDNRAYMNMEEDKEKQKQKQEASQTPRVQNPEGTLAFINFWSIYDDLERKEQEDPANHMTVDKDTVNHDKLHQALVSSGNFYVGDATQIISDMVKDGRLTIVSYHTYRRK